MTRHKADDAMKWVRRGSALAVLLIGWTFILFTNHFHITPPVVFAGLGYFAIVAAIYTLFRMGATAVSANNEVDDLSSWGRPLGPLGELEREKRTLLKAIKEAEFDQQMGKLSKADAEAMITIYRARAIEVIKEIDVQNTSTGQVGSVRERILREARARIEIAERVQPAANPKDERKAAAKNDKQKKRADKLAAAVTAAKAPKTDGETPDDAKAEATATADAKAEAKAEETEATADAKAEAKAEETEATADAKAEAETPDAQAATASADDATMTAKEAAR